MSDIWLYTLIHDEILTLNLFSDVQEISVILYRKKVLPNILFFKIQPKLILGHCSIYFQNNEALPPARSTCSTAAMANTVHAS